MRHPPQPHRSVVRDDRVVYITPFPPLTAFERPDDRMTGVVEMLFRMLVLRAFAAPDVPTCRAHAQVHPRVAAGLALGASGVGGRHVLLLVAMCACGNRRQVLAGVGEASCRGWRAPPDPRGGR